MPPGHRKAAGFQKPENAVIFMVDFDEDVCQGRVTQNFLRTLQHTKLGAFDIDLQMCRNKTARRGIVVERK